MHNTLYKSLLKNISYSIKQSLFEYNNAKNGDEYYTLPKDAAKEISKFKYHYNGKIIYCNCDNPQWSEIYKFIKSHFYEFGIKKLIATYLPRPNENQQPYKYDYDGVQFTKTKIKSSKFQDNIDILKEADIIISSPPFSDKQVREFLKLCINNNKRFLFIGPLALWRKSDLIEYFKKGIVQADDTIITHFNTPDNLIKDVPCAWFTNFPVHKKLLNTGKTFENTEKVYDEQTNILVVKRVKDIPMDYDDIIATSERFITKINLKQYEILGTINPVIDSKIKAAKILIRKK